MHQSFQRLFAFAGGLVLMGTLLVFFGFHTIFGERGLLAREDIDREIQASRETLALLDKQNHFLKHRIRLLRSGAIDADMLAETARSNVGMYNENDVIISINLSKLKF